MAMFDYFINGNRLMYYHKIGLVAIVTSSLLLGAEKLITPTRILEPNGSVEEA